MTGRNPDGTEDFLSLAASRRLQPAAADTITAPMRTSWTGLPAPLAFWAMANIAVRSARAADVGSTVSV